MNRKGRDGEGEGGGWRKGWKEGGTQRMIEEGRKEAGC